MQTSLRIFAVLALVVTTATAATAQEAPAKIATGTWTGSVTPPGQERVDVSFDVTSKNDTISITINAGGHGTFKAEDIKFETTRLVFSFTPGPKVLCVLTRKDDTSFAGDCTEDSGDVAQIVMIPPKKEG